MAGLPALRRLPRLALAPVLALMLAGCSGGGASSTGDAKGPVTVGYQGIVNPWKVAIQSKAFSKATGRELRWRRFSSGSEVITALASGDLDLAVAGSSPIATATSRGLDVELIWIMEAIRDGEALVARKDSGIKTVKDLKGKTVGVPFASTTHYHLLVALGDAGLTTKDLKILDLQPDTILASWTQKHIDAAFVWSPVLDKLKAEGTVVMTSGALADKGRPTFDGLLCRKAFGKSDPGFLATFLSIIARADADYREKGQSWTPESKEIKAISALSGAAPKDCVAILGQYAYPSLDEQTSETWLGGGKTGGAAKALAQTAKFLKEQKAIQTLHADYSGFVNASYAEAAKTVQTQPKSADKSGS